MGLAERLRLLVKSAPPDATVPVRWIGELLDQDEGTVEPAIPRDGYDPVMPDLSVEDIMTATSRGRSTVIAWIHVGDFPGAYKLNGREWRIPRADWKAFLSRKREGRPAPVPSSGQGVDLGRWRDRFGKGHGRP